ncbi:hypothetical protein Moror_4677 [Moniliophthora roreri MCA 2997]|uniref:Uncharacterized protein n=1 Tax=Moniliophthora roreri (strain MCA 2997) TaxID=1381753 RepID=V2YKR2_MONRO|nr:hypothetical protein Moror_4677 [Moniliophthora roreri MCA 2997]
MSLLQQKGLRHVLEIIAAKGEKPKAICLEVTSRYARDRYSSQLFIAQREREINTNELRYSNLEAATGAKMYCMVNWEPNLDYRR